MNDAFEELGKKLSETAETLAGKTNDLIEIQKLKNQIRVLKRGNMRDYSDIGKMYYEKFKAGEEMDAEVAALCETINGRNEQIAGFEQDVETRKNTI